MPALPAPLGEHPARAAQRGPRRRVVGIDLERSLVELARLVDARQGFGPARWRADTARMPRRWPAPADRATADRAASTAAHSDDTMWLVSVSCSWKRSSIGACATSDQISVPASASASCALTRTWPPGAQDRSRQHDVDREVAADALARQRWSSPPAAIGR